MHVRSITAADLPALLSLARSTGVGVTSLPANEARLAARIDASLAASRRPAQPAVSSFVFVLEDETTGQVVGICGLEGSIGEQEPWYNYRVGLSVRASRELNICRKLNTLFLTNDLDGAAELCSLFLHPDWRIDGNGSLLSKSRFLFLAEFPEFFHSRVIAEMRGVSDAEGRSPFWEGLGRHFFSMEFSHADYLTGLGHKSFIAELMPQHVVYVDFLPPEARAVIGQVHEATRPARAMLEAEGLRYGGYVDIFDAGPTLECELLQIRAVRESQIFSIVLGSPPVDGIPCLVANRHLSDFRVCVTPVAPDRHHVTLTPSQCDTLNLQAGDTVRVVPLSPRHRLNARVHSMETPS